MGDKYNTSGAVGFLGLLTILFIGLKLTGYVNWSWWWILVPLWGPLVLLLIIIIVLVIIVALVNLFEK